MLFMNEYEVARCGATATAITRSWGRPPRPWAPWSTGPTAHSDGWAYWPKPCRAAKALQELIGTTRTYLDDPDRESVTIADLKRAYRPLRAFATRHGADFPFYLPGD
jgi:hypothetical protein